MIESVAIQLATLAIVSAGACVMFTPLRKFSSKLLVVGILLAAAASVIPAHVGR